MKGRSETRTQKPGKTTLHLLLLLLGGHFIWILLHHSPSSKTWSNVRWSLLCELNVLLLVGSRDESPQGKMKSTIGREASKKCPEAAPGKR